MDPPLLHTDESAPPLSDGHTGDLDCSLSHSPTEIASLTYKKQMEMVSGLSDHIKDPVPLPDKITSPLSDVSSPLPQETVTDSDCREAVEPLPPNRRVSLRSEPEPNLWDCHAQDGDISVQNYSGSSISPHSFSLIQNNEAAGIFSSLSHLSDSLTEIDAATEPMSDLYIFESGTQDFILSPQNPSLDPQQINCPVYPSSSSQQDKGTYSGQDTHALILSRCDSVEMATQSHHFSESGDPDPEPGQHIKLGPAAVAVYEKGLMSSSGLSQDKAEVSGLTPKAQESDSPNELWLDARQYWAGEDKENGDGGGVQTILDGSGHSMVWATGGDTKVSGYPRDESDGIGWARGDMGDWGAPVERWSSVDSWASALSDWAAIISAPPEDFTAAFTEIGAEIDSLTQALAETHTEAFDKLTKTLVEGQGQEESRAESEAEAEVHPMAIQDPASEPQPNPESSILSGQSCFSGTLTEPAEPQPELQDRKGTCISCIPRSTTQGDTEPGEGQRLPCTTDSSLGPSSLGPSSLGPSSLGPSSLGPSSLGPSSLGPSGGMLARPGGYSADMAAVGSPSPAVLDEIATDLSQLGYVEAMETDVYIRNEENPFLLHITEDTDEGSERENSHEQLKTEEPFKDGVCKVTEEPSVSQRGAVSHTEGGGSYGTALTGSGSSSSEAETPEFDSEDAKGFGPQFFSTAPPLTNAHVSAVETPPALHTAQVSSDPSQDLDRCQGQLQRRVPQFVMPLAPLNTGPPLFCWTSSTLRGDHDGAKRSFNDIRGHRCALTPPRVPTFEGSTNKSLLEGHKEKSFIHKKDNTINSAGESSPDQQMGELMVCSDSSLSDRNTATITQEISDLSRELSNLVIVPGDNFLISDKDRIAYIILDLDDPFASRPIATGLLSPQTSAQPESNQKKTFNMPHRSHKSASEGRTRSKKDKSAGYHHAAPASKTQENIPQVASSIQDTHPHTGGAHTKGPEDKEMESVTMSKTIVVTEKVSAKKKKKKHTQNSTVVKNEVEPLAEVENGAKQKAIKGRIDIFEDKLGIKIKTKEKPIGFPGAKDCVQSDTAEKPQAKALQGEKPLCGVDHHPTKPTNPLNDDAIKRRRLSENKFGKMVGMLESKLTKTDVSIQAKREEPKAEVGDARRREHSEVVKQKTHKPEEEPLQVVQPIQAVSVSDDPQSLCLWCQFTAVFSNYTVTWSRESTVLTEIQRSAGDESRVSLTLSNASHKDLGKYQCRLSSSHGSATLDYLLTYEVLSEIVIPASPKNIPPALAEVTGTEEDVHCSRLMFREDFLNDQYFGENQHASIITEKAHFGEGMHRRAFRTKLQAGLVPLFTHGHPCVLKVHNAITYGTKNNEELIQKNFNLAVEECHVQNTAREYIKAYTAVAQSAEAFGEVPDIIPIYLVHRPSNDIPYATLEEELIGDFVKYSVRDGKEINLMRRDSEAGQKCCAFQHWVYNKTEGNLLITDMQGVGMQLTDVGIATSKKGYKGFKGNCATSFIEQFKALHQCNKYCEILGLKSLQPKPKKTVSAPKPKPPPSAAPKKKTFGPTVKDKS